MTPVILFLVALGLVAAWFFGFHHGKLSTIEAFVRNAALVAESRVAALEHKAPPAPAPIAPRPASITGPATGQEGLVAGTIDGVSPSQRAAQFFKWILTHPHGSASQTDTWMDPWRTHDPTYRGDVIPDGGSLPTYP